MKVNRHLIFLFVLYFFVFQSMIAQVFPVFNYWDEFYALLCILIWAIHLKGKVRINNNLKTKVVILLIIYICIGCVSNMIYSLQVIQAVLLDIFLNLKFFLGIGTTVYLFKNYSLESHKCSIKFHIKIILTVLFVLIVINKIFHVFPQANIRFGLASEVLFFYHPTNFAAAVFFLTVLLMLVYEKRPKDIIFIAMALLLIMSTLRFKAIASEIVFIYFYFIIIVLNKRIRLVYLIVLLPFVLLIGLDEFVFYFFSNSSMDMARGALTYTSFLLARDYFPFGTGFGTFASALSADFYSPLYHMYHINNVWGLGQLHSGYVSDVFWPMILGQTGVMGLLVYILIVVQLFKLIKPLYKIDNKYYLSGLGVLSYLLISSVAESAFVSYIAVPLSIIIGMSVCKMKKYGSK